MTNSPPIIDTRPVIVFTRDMAEALTDALLPTDDGWAGTAREWYATYGSDTMKLLLKQRLFTWDRDRLVLSSIGERVAKTLEPARETYDFTPGGDAEYLPEHMWGEIQDPVIRLIERLYRIEKLDRLGKRCGNDETCDWSATLEFKIKDRAGEMSGVERTVQTCIRHPMVNNDDHEVVHFRSLPNRGSKRRAA